METIGNQKAKRGPSPAVYVENYSLERPKMMSQPKYSPKAQKNQQEENIYGLADAATRVIQYDPESNLELPPVTSQRRNGARVQPKDLAPKSKTKEPVPKASDLLSQHRGSQVGGAKPKNYISENRNRVVHELHPPPLKEPSLTPDHHKNFGKVPNYLNKYRHEADER